MQNPLIALLNIYSFESSFCEKKVPALSIIKTLLFVGQVFFCKQYFLFATDTYYNIMFPATHAYYEHSNHPDF